MTAPTIFARSTGALPSAIAILRVSGAQAGAALAALSGKALPEARRAVVRKLRDMDGALLDEAMVLWLPGPETATGEDLVELHLHGGRAVVAGVEAALAAVPGLRAAEPGEFTRRAFENGRIDLSQVEGLADLLAAETARQRASALAMSEGGLRRRVEDWQAAMLELAARVEAAIDHDEEVAFDGDALDADTAALTADMRAMLAHPPAERLRDGVRVVVAGPPNAGKSTLINALSGRDAAIVSPQAGTTRDVIEVPLALDGVPLVLSDTAGLRGQASDDIESEGIYRASAAMARADLILWLGTVDDVPMGVTPILVAAKTDLAPPAGRHDVAVSAATGDGLAALRNLLVERARTLLPGIGALTLSESQRLALQDCAGALDASVREADVVLRAESLRTAMAALDRITGRADTEAMLDALFGRFCLGK